MMMMMMMTYEDQMLLLGSNNLLKILEISLTVVKYSFSEEIVRSLSLLIVPYLVSPPHPFCLPRKLEFALSTNLKRRILAYSDH